MKKISVKRKTDFLNVKENGEKVRKYKEKVLKKVFLVLKH